MPYTFSREDLSIISRSALIPEIMFEGSLEAEALLEPWQQYFRLPNCQTVIFGNANDYTLLSFIPTLLQNQTVKTIKIFVDPPFQGKGRKRLFACTTVNDDPGLPLNQINSDAPMLQEFAAIGLPAAASSIPSAPRKMVRAGRTSRQSVGGLDFASLALESLATRLTTACGLVLREARENKVQIFTGFGKTIIFLFAANGKLAEIYGNVIAYHFEHDGIVIDTRKIIYALI